MAGGKINNSWRGPKGQSSVPWALVRSAAVNKVIDTFTIQATLNNNIMDKYAF
jgi:hypothetical protein